MKLKTLFFYGIFILCWTGCSTLTPWTQLNKTEYRDTARGFTATIPKGWMRNNHVRYFLITRDGAVLERIFAERIRFKDDLEFTKKKFSQDMTPQELAEVEMDNIESNQRISRVKFLKNEPATVDGQTGFHLHYTFETEDGLKVEGKEFGFIHGDFVYRVGYEASAQHYFREYLGDFTRFFKSFRLIRKNS